VGVLARINGAAPPVVPLADIDLGSWNFWQLDDELRDGAFATLRREAPITFHREPAQDGIEPGQGHWALTRYADIFHASRHPEIFSSSPTVTIYDAPEVAELLGSMIVLDDPRHRWLRNTISKGFTRKAIAHTEASVRTRARLIVESMVANHPDGTADLIAELAGPLPVQVICDMMGIPDADHQAIFRWTDTILGIGDADVATDEQFMNAAAEMGAYANALADDRRASPHDDLTTVLATAEFEGKPLTSSEIASLFRLLVIAGAESTRYSIGHGVLALTRYPDERRKWWADFDGLAHSAVEEIVRWTSPFTYMRRTVTEDTELSGTSMAAGGKVTLWYSSANRDEAKFADPWTFDVGRSPHPPHFGFGGGGAHFCLGAHLARLEIRAAFAELHRQIPDIVAAEEPARSLSAFVNGIENLPVAWTPPS
jgi:cytochrome P450